MMKASPLVLMATLLGAVAAPAECRAQGQKEGQQVTSAPIRLPVESRMPALSGAKEWLNSPPLTTPGLRGKVVIVDFWTYTCINWLRSLPYVRAWAEKYRSQGLVVIGVHTPEFEFEKNVDNVRDSLETMRIDYPVAIDSDYAIWNAFSNHYWPALYFIDAKGNVRHHQFGEGGYEESERVIQQLLAEAGRENVNRELATVEARGPEVAADWTNLQTPENYLGFDRTDNFSSPDGAARGKQRIYVAPGKLKANHWALAGDWTMGRHNVVLNASNGRIIYRFHARDLHLVMGPAKPGKPVRFRVRIDGRPPGTDHGSDTDAEGNGTVTGQRLYQLIRQQQAVVDRQFEIEFLEPGIEAYAFTFG